MNSAQLHKLHRRIGIIVVVFVILLVVTGLLLNHTGRLGLDRIYVQSEWLLDRYAIGPSGDEQAFMTGDNRVTRIGDRIYFNTTELATGVESLVGAVTVEDVVVVAVKDQLLLLTTDGAVIERLSGHEGVPAGMKAIGTGAGSRLVIDAAHGYYVTGVDALEWEKSSTADAAWSVPAELPEKLRAELLQAYRGRGLSLERVILDLHSGRFLGAFGVYVIDAMALLFLCLGITGIWMLVIGRRL